MSTTMEQVRDWLHRLAESADPVHLDGEDIRPLAWASLTVLDFLIRRQEDVRQVEEWNRISPLTREIMCRADWAFNAMEATGGPTDSYRIVASGCDLAELGRSLARKAGDAKPFPNRSSAPETQTAPVEAGAVNSQENNNL